MEKDWAAERARAEAIEGRVAALEAAVAMLTQGLFERGDITINDVRATLGLPPFRGLWADSPGYVQAVRPDERGQFIGEDCDPGPIEIGRP